MPAFLIPLLLSLFSSLPGKLGDYFKGQQDIQKAQLDTQLQIELAKAKLAGEIAQADAERATTTLGVTGNYFKYFTFIMWFGPFMLGVIFPHTAVDIFANLKLMPEWYVQSCLTIMFTVWGLSVSQPVLTSIFSGLGDFFANRQKLSLNKKLFYDTLRSVQGPIGEHEVALFEKAIDAMSNENKG